MGTPFGPGKPRPLPLERTIVYGPIRSRRLGVSLGLNILPVRYKICSFDCIYCHYGRTDLKIVRPPEAAAREVDFPTLGEVIGALDAVLRRSKPVDTITFSGNGEPTLHPYFAQIVFEVRRLRDRLCPGAGLALFSNATTIVRPEIRASLQHIDVPILKLDAGDADTFTRINCPAPSVYFEDLVDALGRVTNLTVQTVLVDGPASNVSDLAFEAWMATLADLRPVQVQIYSTDYPVPDTGVHRVPPYRLRQLAEMAGRRVGVPVRAYWPE